MIFFINIYENTTTIVELGYLFVLQTKFKYDNHRISPVGIYRIIDNI